MTSRNIPNKISSTLLRQNIQQDSRPSNLTDKVTTKIYSISKLYGCSKNLLLPTIQQTYNKNPSKNDSRGNYSGQWSLTGW